MKKFLETINIFKNIKKYLSIKKVEGYSEDKKNSFWIYLIDILIILLFAVIIFYIFVMHRDNDVLRISGYVSIAFLAVFFMVRVTVFVLNYEKKYGGIGKLILIDEEKGINIKAWDITGKASVLIGKTTKDGEVDVDLSEVAYSTLVSRQHAVMNYAADSWYIEDIGSANGSGIKRMNENSKFRMEKGQPYKLNAGDIIYIANTKLLAK